MRPLYHPSSLNFTIPRAQTQGNPLRGRLTATIAQRGSGDEQSYVALLSSSRDTCSVFRVMAAQSRAERVLRLRAICIRIAREEIERL